MMGCCCWLVGRMAFGMAYYVDICAVGAHGACASEWLNAVYIYEPATARKNEKQIFKLSVRRMICFLYICIWARKIAQQGDIKHFSRMYKYVYVLWDKIANGASLNQRGFPSNVQLVNWLQRNATKWMFDQLKIKIFISIETIFGRFFWIA